MSRIWFPDGCKLAINWKRQWHHNLLTWCHHQFFCCCYLFFDVVVFSLSSLVIAPSFMSISSLVLELWQFSLIKNWPKIQKWEILQSEICPVSGDYGKLRIPNLAKMSLMFYWIMQNARVTAFTISELLR